MYLLQNKSQAFTIFLQFKSLAEKQLGTTLKALQFDNAKEYLTFTPYLTEQGIHHRLTCSYTHEENGTPERKHRHLTETGLTLLASTSLPSNFWGESFNIAAIIINYFPSPALNNISPFEFSFHKNPDYKFLRVFGCGCYPMLRPYNKHKLDFRSHMCLFIGYSSQHKGYKCLSPSGKCYISRHVIFHESVFPYKLLGNPFVSASSPLSSNSTSSNPLLVLFPTTRIFQNDNDTTDLLPNAVHLLIFFLFLFCLFLSNYNSMRCYWLKLNTSRKG